MGIVQDLEQKKNFTDTEIAIADYILMNPDEIKDLGIVDLADATFSSNAAIIRLCRKLGLNGYKEFRIAFVSDLEKIRHLQKDTDVDKPFDEVDGTASIMRNIANVSQAGIEESYALIPPGRLNTAARMLRQAKRIYIYAAGDSLITAKGFANYMLKIGKIVIFPADYLESTEITSGSDENDVAMVISYSGYILASMQREIKTLKRNRTPLIVVSSIKECEEADLHIPVPDRERSIGRIAGFYSQSSIRYILNCLFGIVYSKDMEKNKEFKNKTEVYNYTDLDYKQE
ncbi:MAG: MurR/RpiR family transcriptional regulator [Erysipelotrichaceae bacterium]|nr:MurR/RpiR family transcriptional regulator [Erysipelotrichaceae bacterium]